MILERFNTYPHGSLFGVEHDLDLSRLSAILVMLGALNIFYAMFGIMEGFYMNTLILVVNYFFIIYLATLLEEIRGEKALERKRSSTTTP